MSFILENVTRSIAVNGNRRTLFDALNIEIRAGERVGFLAPSKAGKTLLLKIMCGTERADEGRIHRGMRVSWPIGTSDFFSPSSSIAWNVRSIARFYGVTAPDFARRVAEIGGIAANLNTPLSACPPPGRQLLAWSLGIAMDFDLYLFDNLAVPAKKEFKDQATAFLNEYTAGRAIFVASSVADTVATHCESTYVLEDGHATFYEDVSEGVKRFKEVQKAEAERRKVMEEEVGQEVSEESDQSMEMLGAIVAAL